LRDADEHVVAVVEPAPADSGAPQRVLAVDGDVHAVAAHDELALEHVDVARSRGRRREQLIELGHVRLPGSGAG
jgi:hypothetical protein